MIVAFFAAGAWAFGGGFVSDGTAPTASGGTVVLAWDGTDTTLTFAPLASGGSGAFALIVPLPSNPGPDAMRTVSADSVASALAFTAPRLVAYTCEDLHPFGQDTGYYYYGYYGYYGYEGEYVETSDRVYNGPFRWSSGRGPFFCGPQGCGSQWYGPYGYWTNERPPPPDTGVDTGTEGGSGEIVAIVEPGPSWSATYDAAIVAADTRADVDLWFSDRSLVPTVAQDAAIDTYLGAGRAFLVAAVTGTGEGALPPLQVTLAGRAEDVAVRLGQLQSPGAQDLVVLALDATPQRQEVADWEKVAIADTCMLDVDDAAAFAASYQDAFAGSLEPLPAADTDTDAAETFAAWAVEFDGNGADCDPCAGELTTAQLSDLGLDREPMDVHLTRLHLRYSADAAVEDVHLVTAPDDAMTLAYVQYDRLLEADFPVCGEGFVEDPRSCPQARSSREPREPRWPRGAALGGLVLGVGLWLRRRAKR